VSYLAPENSHPSFCRIVTSIKAEQRAQSTLGINRKSNVVPTLLPSVHTSERPSEGAALKLSGTIFFGITGDFTRLKNRERKLLKTIQGLSVDFITELIY